MLPSALITKLRETATRHAELQDKLNDPDVLSDSKQLVAISKESGRLAPVVEMFADFEKTTADIAEMEALADDPEMAELAAEELPPARDRLATLEQQLLDRFLAAEDSGVDKFFIELRAGTGGDEAALFVRDLLNMYQVFCETRGWAFAVDDFSETEHGGFKEAIISVRGDEAYRHLKFEAGGHRVQRVPETETQGRIHTSAATVAVLPELEDVEIHIDPKDIEEGGCRGGGPGGQNVNKVETGWRISHKPSGLQFKITEQKSQGQNKERAWALLRSTLYEM
ncbi:MAG: PCRF domain-containing protein [Planctomycetota bacterium]